MRDGHGFDEKFLEARLDGGFDFLHATHQLLDLGARALVQQGDARAGAGGVAGRADLAELAVGNHAQHHGVLDVDMAAKGASQADALDLVHAHALHQQAHAGVERGLAELDRAHIVLRDAQAALVGRRLGRTIGRSGVGGMLACAAQFIAEGAPVGLNARVARSHGAVDAAVVADHPGQVELGDDFDDARAADACDAALAGCLGKARVVRPQIAADHLVARLQGDRVDAYALDGAGRGALAAADLRALEGWAGRAGTGQQAAVVAQHDLGIGADIDQQGDLFAQVGPLGQDHAGGISTDMPGDAGQHVDARVAVDGKVDLHRPQGDGFVGGQGKRRATQFHRVDAQQQVMHDGIADESGFQNVGGGHADLA